MLYFCYMSEEVRTLFHKLLKDNGQNITRPRGVVFDLLWGHEPQSMRDLGLRSRHDIDRASLYRTIELFERLGIVQRVYIGWKYKLELSDIFESHHHHISCLGCGKVVAIKENEEIERLIRSLAAKSNMTTVRHQLEIQGYCEKCR